MEYINKETGQIESEKEIRFTYNEIMHNSSYTESDLEGINTFEEFKSYFYEEMEEVEE